MDELLDFAFHQTAYRDVRPFADDVGNVLFVHFFLEHALALLRVGQMRLFVANSALELRQSAILQL